MSISIQEEPDTVRGEDSYQLELFDELLRQSYLRSEGGHLLIQASEQSSVLLFQGVTAFRSAVSQGKLNDRRQG